MTNPFESYEDFNAFLNEEKLNDVQKELDTATAQENPLIVPPIVCTVWKVAKPIIEGINKIPFIPKKIKKALEMLIRVLDLVC